MSPCVCFVFAAFVVLVQMPAEEGIPIDVACSVVVDGEGYAQGVRTRLKNLTGDNFYGIAVNRKEFKYYLQFLLNSDGRPVSPDIPFNAMNEDENAKFDLIILRPRSALVFYSPLPDTIKDFSVHNADGSPQLIPVPNGKYTLRFRPSFACVQLKDGKTTMEPDKPIKYQFCTTPMNSFNILISKEKYVADWVVRWAD